jgi:hypothetical protein
MMPNPFDQFDNQEANPFDQFDGGQVKPAAATPSADIHRPEQGGIQALLEPAATIASAIAAEPIAGIAGIVQSLNPFAEEGAGAEAVASTREALTYQPRTEGGKQVLSEVGGVVEPAGKVFSNLETSLGDFAFDLTGSPTISAAAASAPTMIGELLGLKSLKALRTGEKLLDATGQPTKILRRELNKQGLDYGSLTPEAKKLIPEEVGPELLPGSKPIRREVENTVIEQINAGGREDSLATLKVTDGRLRGDKLGAAAVKQGFRPGIVQAIKTSSKATKTQMRKMLKTMRRIKNNERVAMDTRPSDVVGDSISERIGYISESANTARKELDEIAKTKLPGVQIDTTQVLETLRDSLADLDVRLVMGKTGKPVADFVESLISSDRSSQRVIRDLVRLLGEGGNPDALRFHKLKRQLDIMIDFNKKSSMGLSDAGKNVLKDIRRSLNESIRAIDDDYARVNDVLSLSLGTLGDLDKAVGTIDLFGAGANKALGQRMRALMSNQQGRIKVENALDQINDTTKKLGGAFTDDIKDLVLFADALDDKFGAVAKTSFAGQIEQAVGRAVSAPPKTTVVEAVGRGIGKGAEKMRGINDFNSFEALDALLR